MNRRTGTLAALLVALLGGPAYSQPEVRGGLTPEAPQAPEAEPDAARKPGRRVAILVGVGKFKHDLADLQGSPQKDVEALAKVLKEGGFEVVALIDERATKAEVERRFRAVVDGGGDATKSLGKADLLLVGVCTHGFSLPPAPGQPDAPFLAAHDSKLDRPDTMVGLDGLLEQGKSSGATVLFLLDACREVAPGKGRGQARGIEPTQATLPKGTAILFGCGRGEVSHQNDKAGGHGLFTFAVLKTLRGEAGLSGDVSWSELVAAVQKMFRTPELKAMMPPQRPQTPVAAGGELAHTELLTVVGLMADDLRAYEAAGLAGPPTSKGAIKRLEHLKAAVPTRLATWKRSAEKGDAAAMVLYAHCFDAGIGVEKDRNIAGTWYLKAAEAGNTKAMLITSRRYEHGIGTPKDQRAMVKWSRKAADAGHSAGMCNVGLAHESGWGGLKKDDTEAARWFRTGAEAGGAQSMCKLGSFYQDGRGGLPKDEAESLRWFVKAAETGAWRAILGLAQKLDEGRGTKKNPAEATRWIRQAAEGGAPQTMTTLGWRYVRGTGVKNDDAEGAYWFRKAIDAGSTDATGMIGWCYEYGRGVPKDLDKAAEWYRKLDAAGNPDGKVFLKRIGRK